LTFGKAINGMQPYFERDGITIYHGDARELLSTLEAVDLVLTDPPYGITLENHGRTDGKRRDRDWTVAGDQDTEIGQLVIDYCLDRGWPLVAFASPEHPWRGDWRSLLVWHKYGLGMGGDPKTCWQRDWELIQVAQNRELVGGRDSAVLQGFDIRPAEFTFHPCQKPVSLMQYLIGKTNAETVVDPFMGSGTTLRAAKNLGRRAIGIEIEERYCEIAAKRLSQGVLL
jgi:site-specific DNA-methyltransferase (adenine-specific)